ncbi:MAG: hypothetical protein AAFU85_19915, partial [Planctomycetota bacterium]
MKFESTHRTRPSSHANALPIAMIVMIFASMGCRTPIGSLAGSSPATPSPRSGDESAVKQAGGSSFLPGTNRLVGFISGQPGGLIQLFGS